MWGGLGSLAKPEVRIGGAALAHRDAGSPINNLERNVRKT
jgi:hypothetical protein